MTREEAKRILDTVRYGAGNVHSADTIRRALRASGDLLVDCRLSQWYRERHEPTPESELVREDGWVERPR